MTNLVVQGLTFNACTIGAGPCQPWRLSAQGFADRADQQGRKILEPYFALKCPASVPDRHDLNASEPPKLRSMLTYGSSVLPWKAKDPGDIIGQVDATQTLERRSYGFDAGMKAGAEGFGRITERKLRVEIQRQTVLERSTSAHSFKWDAPN